MDALTTFTVLREFERAVALLDRSGIEHTVISPSPAYDRVACPAIAVSDAARAACFAGGGTDIMHAGWVDYRQPAREVPDQVPPQFDEDVVGRVAVVVLMPCVADADRLRLTAEVSGDLAATLPYVNAESPHASYAAEVPALTYLDGHRIVSLFRDRVAVAKANDIVDAWSTYHGQVNSLATPTQDPVRQARLAQSLTVGWMVVELIVALAAGIAARSIALTAFGFDSGIEVFTSLVVLRQLLLRIHSASEEQLDHGERRASRLIGLALYGLIAYIVISSVASLIARARPEASTAGLVLAVVVLVVMPVLWRWRLSLARRLDSPALRADCACSVVCIYMSTTLLAGLLLNRLFGWWWADPLAGLAMIWWIRGEASEALEAAESGKRED